MKEISKFTKLFIKDIVYEKGALIWTLLLPTVLWIINNSSELGEINTEKLYIENARYYLIYMILMSSLSGVGLGLIMIRETGFLKMYTFLAGSKFSIILGKIVSQLVFLFLCVTLFLATSFLLCGLKDFSVPIAILFYTVVGSIPVFLLAALLGLFPYKLENISSGLTIAIFPMIYFSPMVTTNPALKVLFAFNPGGYLNGIYRVMEGRSVGVDSLLLILMAAIFILIGVISINKMKIVSLISRN